MDNYIPDDERAEAEFNAAMHEYYERKFDVKCAACGLEQSASEHQLREIGWTLGPQEFCFRAACIRDRSAEQLWQDPDWSCPHCKYTNLAVRERCRNCGYDSNAGEFPYYNPLPPYDGVPDESTDRQPIAARMVTA